MYTGSSGLVDLLLVVIDLPWVLNNTCFAMLISCVNLLVV